MELQMKIEVFSTQNASPSKNYTLFKLLFEGCIAVFIGSKDSVERHEKSSVQCSSLPDITLI